MFESAIPIPKKGVKIFFEPRVKMPEWAKSHIVGGEVKHERLHRRMVRSVRISREAVAISRDGGVALKMPESDEFKEVLRSKKVLEVRDFTGKLLIKCNPCLCSACGTLHGKIESYDWYEDTLVSFSIGVFKCTKCGYEYKRRL